MHNLFTVFSVGGGGEIRTHETREGLTVFKTVAIDHSATPPRAKIVPILADGFKAVPLTFTLPLQYSLLFPIHHRSST